MSDPAAEAGDPPAGFEYVARAPFVAHVGPVYQAIDTAPGRMRLGLRVADIHANTLGLMHGGMVATLADSAMARALATLLKRRALTLKMTVDYLDAIRIGEWLEIEGRLADSDGEFAHTSCEMHAAGRLRAKASAVFRLMRPAP